MVSSWPSRVWMDLRFRQSALQPTQPGPQPANASRPKTLETKSGIQKKATILPTMAIPDSSDGGGGLPICKDGEVVGAVGVSGLSAEEDTALAALGVELIGGPQENKN